MTDARTKSIMLRVDQAGEFGATRIYAGQLAVLGNRHPAAREIRHMAAQEDEHLARCNRLIATRRSTHDPAAFLACGQVRPGRRHCAHRPGSGDGLHGCHRDGD